MATLPSRASVLWVVALGLLSAACQTTGPGAPARSDASDWRVIERTGEARHQRFADNTWRSPATGGTIASGSAIETGRGGRLIVHRPRQHLSIGPASRILLPRDGVDGPLEQRAGWLRYRIAASPSAPFVARTPEVDLEIGAAVADVRVERGATEIEVIEGEVRVSGGGGLRADLSRGQSALALAAGEQRLAIRRGPNQPLETVVPTIVPAMLPKDHAADGGPDDRGDPRLVADDATTAAAWRQGAEGWPLAHAIDAPMLETPRRVDATQGAAAERPENVIGSGDASDAATVVSDDVTSNAADGGSDTSESAAAVGATTPDLAAVEATMADPSEGPAWARAAPARSELHQVTPARARQEARQGALDRLTEGMVDRVAPAPGAGASPGAR